MWKGYNGNMNNKTEQQYEKNVIETRIIELHKDINDKTET